MSASPLQRRKGRHLLTAACSGRRVTPDLPLKIPRTGGGSCIRRRPLERFDHGFAAIGPASAHYLVRELRAAKPSEIGIIVLRVNTPGGLEWRRHSEHSVWIRGRVVDIDASDFGVLRIVIEQVEKSYMRPNLIADRNDLVNEVGPAPLGSGRGGGITRVWGTGFPISLRRPRRPITARRQAVITTE
jgi:hypothetical protein